MTELRVVGIPALAEPSTAASATAGRTRILESTAPRAADATAHHGRTHRRGCTCGEACISQPQGALTSTQSSRKLLHNFIRCFTQSGSVLAFAPLETVAITTEDEVPGLLESSAPETSVVPAKIHTQRVVSCSTKVGPISRCPHDSHRKTQPPKPTFASLDALSPCMTELRVVGVPTLAEPSTAASATAERTGFSGRATLGAHGAIYCRLRGAWPCWIRAWVNDTAPNIAPVHAILHSAPAISAIRKGMPRSISAGVV